MAGRQSSLKAIIAFERSCEGGKKNHACCSTASDDRWLQHTISGNVEPFLLTDAVRTLRGRPYPLPFVSEPVSTNAMLSRAIDAAFRAPLESLAVDGLIVDLVQGLMAGERGGTRSVISRRVDVRAIERARQFLDAEKTRVVHSTELEWITGLTRYDLRCQFRIMFGTTPYRYLLMRRLEFAREQIHRERPLVEAACDAGFADQAHFTRAFRSAFGLTPAQYRALCVGRTASSVPYAT
jgi:AraC-like DNA-binding protein